MKQEFKTAELRETATNIRDAIMAKSVTAQMVGGTMLALVEASGEVIEALGNLETEKVTVKVQACNKTARTDVAGAKVYIDIFCNNGLPNFQVPRKEVEVDANGEVTFEVYKGFQYAVFSKLAGFGASMQVTFEACQDERKINLWHFPVGVFMLGEVGYCDENDEYRYVPFVNSSYDTEDYEDVLEWDIREGEYVDESYYNCILVSTAETSFVIDQNTKAASTMQWCGNRYYGKLIPTLPAYNPDTCGDWSEAQGKARADFDGNLNTAKILSFCRNANAAEFCAGVYVSTERQSFLPSAGQLYLMYLNKAAINALVTAANADSCEYDAVDNSYYWSSTQYDEWCAWRVTLNGGYTGNYYRGNDRSFVRAVSAFLFSA